MTHNEDTTNFDGLLASGDVSTGFISGATFNLPNQKRVIDAIVHWQEKTPIRFV
jgi:hypothetical protein